MRHAVERDGAEALVRSSVTVERFAFLTAYIMRKLKEADELTRDVTDSKWPVTRFPCVVSPPHRQWFRISTDEGKTWHQPLDRHYDLAKGNRETLPFFKVCDYIVHHFAFAVRYDDATAEIGLFFNSDHTKNRLFRIALPVYVALVHEVATDETGWVSMNRDRQDDPVVRRRRRPSSP